MSKYLTLRETAKMLHVTTQTLRNWDKRSMLKSLRNPINNYRVYRITDIQYFMHKLESKGKIILG
ncbi:MAG: MerR family DNA-binding transcriptional regulator [bacterium]